MRENNRSALAAFSAFLLAAVAMIALATPGLWTGMGGVAVAFTFVPELSKLLTLPEAADLLRLKVSTLRA